MCPYFNDKNIPRKCGPMDQSDWDHMMEKSNFMWQALYCLAAEHTQVKDVARGFANCDVYKCILRNG